MLKKLQVYALPTNDKALLHKTKKAYGERENYFIYSFRPMPEDDNTVPYELYFISDERPVKGDYVYNYLTTTTRSKGDSKERLIDYIEEDRYVLDSDKKIVATTNSYLWPNAFGNVKAIPKIGEEFVRKFATSPLLIKEVMIKYTYSIEKRSITNHVKVNHRPLTRPNGTVHIFPANVGSMTKKQVTNRVLEIVFPHVSEEKRGYSKQEYKTAEEILNLFNYGKKSNK